MPNQYPYRYNTTQGTAAEDDPRYETPGGAANKIEQALVDANEYTDDSLLAYVAQTLNIADDAVTRSKIASGAVGATELDPTLLDYTTDIAVAAKFNEVDVQLDDTEKITGQEDFIETLQRHMTYKGQFNILPNNVTSAFNVSVLYDIGNGKAVSYTFFKQAGIDDFLMLGIGRYGNLVTNHSLFSQKNFDSRTGTWNDVSTYYTTQVGATMTVSFYGSQLAFHHFTDNRGGIWEFVVDGDTANKVIVSTWAATSGDVDTIIFTQLSNMNHTVVATFKGDDPSHAPTGGTSRGWANFISGQFTFNTYIYATTNSAIIETMVGGSNKEFAFQIRKHGTTDPYYFVPYHTTMTAYKAADPIFLVDGVATTLTAGLAINGAKNLKIIQNIYGRVPEHVGENLIKISIITTFAADGTVSWDGKMEVLIGVDVSLGYVDMLPLNPVFSKVLVTGFENKYPTLVADGSTTVLADEADLCTSFLALNDSTYKNVGVVMQINNAKQSLRQGQSGRGEPFIHHRVDDNQKVYEQVYNNAYLPAGYVHRFSGTIYIAAFEGLYDLF